MRLVVVPRQSGGLVTPNKSQGIGRNLGLYNYFQAYLPSCPSRYPCLFFGLATNGRTRCLAGPSRPCGGDEGIFVALTDINEEAFKPLTLLTSAQSFLVENSARDCFQERGQGEKAKKCPSRQDREDRGSIRWGPPDWIDLSDRDAKLGDEGESASTVLRTFYLVAEKAVVGLRPVCTSYLQYYY
jgi:hypothetical protein